jgi:hypothetical protein
VGPEGPAAKAAAGADAGREAGSTVWARREASVKPTQTAASMVTMPERFMVCSIQIGGFSLAILDSTTVQQESSGRASGGIGRPGSTIGDS